MRFRFCGDLDCPDWVLAEISTLSRLTSIKVKLLCSQVVKEVLGDTIDYEKVHKLTSDAKFEQSDVKASIAALHFILCSAGKYGVEGETLSNELQQLGLPKEHSGSVCKTYSDSLSSLQSRFRERSLRLSGLEDVQWRVDYILSSSCLQDVGEPCVQLKLDVRDPDSGNVKHVVFSVDPEKFSLLLAELKQAQSMMSGLE